MKNFKLAALTLVALLASTQNAMADAIVCVEKNGENFLSVEKGDLGRYIAMGVEGRNKKVFKVGFDSEAKIQRCQPSPFHGDFWGECMLIVIPGEARFKLEPIEYQWKYQLSRETENGSWSLLTDKKCVYVRGE